MRKIRYPEINSVDDLYDVRQDSKCYYLNILFRFEEPRVWLNPHVQGQISAYSKKELYAFLEKNYIYQYVHSSKWKHNIDKYRATLYHLQIEFTANKPLLSLNLILNNFIKSRKIQKKIHEFVNIYYICDDDYPKKLRRSNFIYQPDIRKFKIYIDVSEKQKNNIISF